MMDAKAQAGEYEHLEEFKADAQTIVHNVVIYHGGTVCFIFAVCFLDTYCFCVPFYGVSYNSRGMHTQG